MAVISFSALLPSEGENPSRFYERVRELAKLSNELRRAARLQAQKGAVGVPKGGAKKPGI